MLEPAKTVVLDPKEKVLETLANVNGKMGAVPLSFLANFLDRSLKATLHITVFELREAGLVEVEQLNGWEVGIKLTDLAIAKMARKYLSASDSRIISPNGEVML